MLLISTVLSIISASTPWFVVTSKVDSRRTQLFEIKYCYRAKYEGDMCTSWADSSKDVCGMASAHRITAGLSISGLLLEAAGLAFIAVSVRTVRVRA